MVLPRGPGLALCSPSLLFGLASCIAPLYSSIMGTFTPQEPRSQNALPTIAEPITAAEQPNEKPKSCSPGRTSPRSSRPADSGRIRVLKTDGGREREEGVQGGFYTDLERR